MIDAAASIDAEASLLVPTAMSALVGWRQADEDGYGLRGAHADFGSAFVNGLVAFVVVVVPLWGFAFEISGWMDRLDRRP